MGQGFLDDFLRVRSGLLVFPNDEAIFNSYWGELAPVFVDDLEPGTVRAHMGDFLDGPGLDAETTGLWILLAGVFDMCYVRGGTYSHTLPFQGHSLLSLILWSLQLHGHRGGEFLTLNFFTSSNSQDPLLRLLVHPVGILVSMGLVVGVTDRSYLLERVQNKPFHSPLICLTI